MWTLSTHYAYFAFVIKPAFRNVREMDNTAVGAQARAVRKSKGLSLAQVAERMDFTAMYICDLERGRRTWSPELIARFNKACKK